MLLLAGCKLAHEYSLMKTNSHVLLGPLVVGFVWKPACSLHRCLLAVGFRASLPTESSMSGHPRMQNCRQHWQFYKNSHLAA